ncbi:UNVERIFIED_CONTAM: putative nucleobase-ascorbate transporter 10 [Sesamum angustifolium]|uniref:Nucleobase-ascorbate transporter 10 n=1 Tax=Sesamum angustifolium TaxID=2727405 RepID=A0AAW2JAW1_9LAMI
MPGDGEVNDPQPQPHAVLEQLPGIQYCINSPPPCLEAILLGFQHYILALGSIVLIPSMLVPEMGGSDKDKAKVIQTLLFISGVNTLLHSFFGTRLPSVIGGSYAFLIPATSIIHARKYRQMHEPEQRFVQTMREIQGALIVTSCFQMIIGFTGLWRNLARLFTPLSMVPLITFTGLGLYHLGFPLIATCLEVGIPQLVLLIIISQFLPRFIKSKRHLCDRYALLFSVAIVWMYAGILTWSGAFTKSKHVSCRTDSSGLIGGAPWFYVPFPFQWGPPTFRAGEAFAAMVASFVASIESTGSFISAARYGSATPVPPSVISRGVGWLGIGTLLHALFGSITGSTATVENVGLLALTKAGSRRVVQISSVFMILFSILGKFGAIFASIPLPIMAGSYCIFFGYVSSVGLGFLQFCNLNSFRTKLVLGLSFFIGLSLPQYFREHGLNSRAGPVHTPAVWFNDIMSLVFMSHATVAAVIALVLDCTLDYGTDETRKDNGSYWWEKFVVYGKDVRSDEFYKLPGRLNRCFPSF